LAVSDHEEMTIAKLCQEAGSSIGTFYNRFGDKDRYLYSLICTRLRAAEDAAKWELRASANQKAGTSELVRKIVEHIVSRMGSPRTVGVTRAALKLGSTKPENLEPIAKYRALVSDRAVALLTPRLSVPESELIVRTGLQVVFATVIDATLRNDGPLHMGSASIVDALTDLMEHCLKIEPRNWRNRPGTLDEAETTVNSPMKGDDCGGRDHVIGVIDPDLRVQVGSHLSEKGAHHRTRYRDISSKPRADDEGLRTKVNPAGISQAASEESLEDAVSAEPRRRRYRWI
jgi:AcrR family transcriptional regulator